MEARRQVRRYTYREYREWPEDVRVELIDGVVYDMAPAPHFHHQDLSIFLSAGLFNYLQGKPCKVYTAPTDVLFTDDDETDTVVQPDIFVVCNQKQRSEKGVIVGAPTLIIEVLSPSNERHDLILKRDLYQRHGVLEYWIVSPELKTVSRLVLREGLYADQLFRDGVIESCSLPGFRVELEALFAAMGEISQ